MEINTGSLPLVNDPLDEAEEQERSEPTSGELEPEYSDSGRVVVDERGHNVWEGTIRTEALELDDTEWRLRQLEAGEPSRPASGGDPEPPAASEVGRGFDPYNSSGD